MFYCMFYISFYIEPICMKYIYSSKLMLMQIIISAVLLLFDF